MCVDLEPLHNYILIRIVSNVFSPTCPPTSIVGPSNPWLGAKPKMRYWAMPRKNGLEEERVASCGQRAPLPNSQPLEDPSYLQLGK